MKTSLKERFRNINLIDPSEPILERIGGLYYLGSMADQPEVQEKLKDVLAQIDVKDPQQIQLCLHTAILLAQNGRFEGVNYLLRLLGSDLDKFFLGMVETALRNCSQFPFAVLLALAMQPSELTQGHEDIQKLMTLSDDDLFDQGQQQDYSGTFAQLAKNLAEVNLPKRKPGYGMGIGTLLSTPLRSDRGFRYTGFIVVDRPNGLPLVIPYDMGDILNRNDQRARQDVWQLLRKPGRSVLVVYQEKPPFDAQLLYILPFPASPDQQMNDLLVKLARGCEGIEVGLVLELQVNKRGDYRIITSNGNTRVMSFHRDYQQVGDLFLGHAGNSQLLSTRFKFNQEQAAILVFEFIRKSKLEKAVYLRSSAKRHYYAGSSGSMVSKSGDISTDSPHFVEHYTTKEGKEILALFNVAGAPYNPAERCAILDQFFKQRPDTLGVVLQVYEHESKYYARVVRAKSKEIARPYTEPETRSGTLAYCENGEDNRLYTSILSGYYLSGGCPNCFGTESRLCTTCNATGKVTCPDCGGSRYVVCPTCHGSEKTDCGHCAGKGEKTVECNFCDTPGVCKGCGGTGKRAIGTCNRCNGTGSYGYSTCSKCGGDGKYKVLDNWCQGTGKCNKCAGTGYRKIPCKTCNQTGKWGCGTCHERGQVPCNCDFGSIMCPKCFGERISQCTCGGKSQSKIVAL